MAVHLTNSAHLGPVSSSRVSRAEHLYNIPGIVVGAGGVQLLLYFWDIGALETNVGWRIQQGRLRELVVVEYL
jgi:hypothetical protein